jgi:hypothetical protein
VDGERSLDAAAAVDLAAREAGRLGVALRVRTEGPPAWPVPVTDLIDGTSLRVSGSGKGNGPAARAGADFEALERFYTVSQVNTPMRCCAGSCCGT